MSANDAENQHPTNAADINVAEIRNYLASLPLSDGLTAAVDEGEKIAAIIEPLGLPPEIVAAVYVYPLVSRQSIFPIKTYKTRYFKRYFSICSRTAATQPVFPARELAARRSAGAAAIRGTAQDVARDRLRCAPRARAACRTAVPPAGRQRCTRQRKVSAGARNAGNLRGRSPTASASGN